MKYKNEKGMVFIIVLVIVAAAAVAGIYFSNNIQEGGKKIVDKVQSLQALHLAEAGIANARKTLKSNPNIAGPISNISMGTGYNTLRNKVQNKKLNIIILQNKPAKGYCTIISEANVGGNFQSYNENTGRFIFRGGVTKRLNVVVKTSSVYSSENWPVLGCTGGNANNEIKVTCNYSPGSEIPITGNIFSDRKVVFTGSYTNKVKITGNLTTHDGEPEGILATQITREKRVKTVGETPLLINAIPVLTAPSITLPDTVSLSIESPLTPDLSDPSYFNGRDKASNLAYYKAKAIADGTYYTTDINFTQSWQTINKTYYTTENIYIGTGSSSDSITLNLTSNGRLISEKDICDNKSTVRIEGSSTETEISLLAGGNIFFNSEQGKSINLLRNLQVYTYGNFTNYSAYYLYGRFQAKGNFTMKPPSTTYTYFYEKVNIKTNGNFMFLAQSPWDQGIYSEGNENSIHSGGAIIFDCGDRISSGLYIELRSSGMMNYTIDAGSPRERVLENAGIVICKGMDVTAPAYHHINSSLHSQGNIYIVANGKGSQYITGSSSTNKLKIRTPKSFIAFNHHVARGIGFASVDIQVGENVEIYDLWQGQSLNNVIIKAKGTNGFTNVRRNNVDCWVKNGIIILNGQWSSEAHTSIKKNEIMACEFYTEKSISFLSTNKQRMRIMQNSIAKSNGDILMRGCGSVPCDMDISAHPDGNCIFHSGGNIIIISSENSANQSAQVFNGISEMKAKGDNTVRFLHWNGGYQTSGSPIIDIGDDISRPYIVEPGIIIASGQSAGTAGISGKLETNGSISFISYNQPVEWSGNFAIDLTYARSNENILFGFYRDAQKFRDKIKGNFYAKKNITLTNTDRVITISGYFISKDETVSITLEGANPYFTVTAGIRAGKDAILQAPGASQQGASFTGCIIGGRKAEIKNFGTITYDATIGRTLLGEGGISVPSSVTTRVVNWRQMK
ncbi:MAG: hypothetical protein ABIB46_06615 [bacterium]